MFYYILNIKITSQSLSNFSIELRAAVKFDSDCDIIFMFKMIHDTDFHGMNVS